MSGIDAGVLNTQTFLVFGFILPIWAVLRLRVFGLFTGSALVWILGFLNLSITGRIQGSDVGVLIFVWGEFGWIMLLVYSGLIYVLSLPFYRKPRTSPSDDVISTEPPPNPSNWRYILRHLHPVERMLLAVVIGFHLVMYFLGRIG